MIGEEDMHLSALRRGTISPSRIAKYLPAFLSPYTKAAVYFRRTKIDRTEIARQTLPTAGGWTWRRLSSTAIYRSHPSGMRYSADMTRTTFAWALTLQTLPFSLL